MTSDINLLTGNWNYPTAMRFGVGRLKELGETCKEFGMKNPLLVTDPGLAALPMIEDARVSCSEAGIGFGIFSDIKANPVGRNVDDGVAVFQNGKHDGVIAFGGGSGIDAAKAIAVMSSQAEGVFEFTANGNDWEDIDPKEIPPILAVPTTSGTGSEVGRASIITDEEHHVKRIVFNPKMMPVAVIADPALTVGLPKMITAATGMDALSHNLEAYCSPHFHPMAEGIAIEGIRLVKNFLAPACTDGTSLEARSQMMIASSMGATAFQRGLGGMHALAHPLGALYDAHHGMLNAILMPYVLIRNRSAIEDRMIRLSAYLGLKDPSFDSFLDWILALRQEVGIPNDLSALDIDLEKKELVGSMAVDDPSSGGNPISLTASQYTSLFEKAVTGDLSR
ncbi:iron-containing alcohol dehydrogenase [Sneathiella marina]|uniref:Iron-containing alcohol dehydrogenase n=1 Tax=Sneathiella marina TaxID=2950108 RepID=A0ABY4W7Y3_9PROT|nr:iron-containing alcohol dehydrogenase [Sneathiella marina]USG63009.1 iron-containing alcohol dehydrogenase [Sneathiella marina]